MQLDLLLNIQRKVLGGYINAEEFDVNGSSKEILAIKLSETIFDLPLHKMIVRACNKQIEEGLVPTDYSILEFLNKHGVPRDHYEETEYINVMSEYAITARTFNQYILAIFNHRQGK